VAAATKTTVAPLQDSIQYVTWDGQPYSASLFVQAGQIFFHHLSPNNPSYVNDTIVINYVTPGSAAWQARVEALTTGGYQFQNYATTGACSQVVPCFDHSATFIGFVGWQGERLLAGVVSFGGQLKFSVRPIP
jgi:hypothetical protein